MTQNACQELLKDCKNQDYIANVTSSFDGFRLVKGALQLLVSYMAATAEKTGKIFRYHNTL